MRPVLEFLSFKRLMMPYMLQVLFWAGIGGTLYGTYWLYTHDNWAWWMALVFGILMTKLIFESLMVRYRTYECILAIRNSMEPQDSSRPKQ